jgi:hypothetical protein
MRVRDDTTLEPDTGELAARAARVRGSLKFVLVSGAGLLVVLPTLATALAHRQLLGSLRLNLGTIATCLLWLGLSLVAAGLLRALGHWFFGRLALEGLREAAVGSTSIAADVRARFKAASASVERRLANRALDLRVLERRLGPLTDQLAEGLRSARQAAKRRQIHAALATIAIGVGEPRTLGTAARVKLRWLGFRTARDVLQVIENDRSALVVAVGEEQADLLADWATSLALRVPAPSPAELDRRTLAALRQKIIPKAEAHLVELERLVARHEANCPREQAELQPIREELMTALAAERRAVRRLAAGEKAFRAGGG